ncbi:MAG: aminopeptidase [Chloroflexi bacterium]|nr:aminopeptidase [Chloroflexota bacterium]MDA8187972.1 aminopeptidase [Dehalococcoidales bacterium]
MYSYTTLIKGARLIVETCMTVQPDNSVLVIADEEHMPVAQAVAGAAYAAGAWPVVANVTPQVTACLASLKVPMEPPPHLAAAMLNSDVILIATNLEWANRFAHVNPVRQAVDRGAKIASIEEGMGSWDLTVADIQETVGRAERIIDALQGVNRVRVVTEKGTDVTVSIEGRPPLKVIPIKEAGVMMGPIPLWGEVAYAAVEDKTEGVIVVDGIMLGVGVPGTLPEPLRWEVKGGRAVRITGGAAAESLLKTLAGSDANANVVAEFAIGTSTKSSFGSPSEKGALGTVHFALGDNSHAYPGGQSLSKLHLDGSVRDVTIEADGKLIVERGVLKV